MKLSFYFFKKWSAYILTGSLPIILFLMIVLSTGDLFMAFIFAILGIIMGGLISSRLLKHPFSALVEGTGITSLLCDSTGVIAPFVSVMPSPPTIYARLNKNKEVRDVYERSLVHTLLVPRNANMTEAYEVDPDVMKQLGEYLKPKKCKVLKLPIGENQDFDALFNSEGKPCFIFNRVLNQFVTKGVLSKLETESTLLHSINHLLATDKSLSNDIRPFASYTIEMLKPKPAGFLKGKWKWILILAIVVMVIFVVILFLPGLLSSVSNMTRGITSPTGDSKIP